MPSTKPTNSKFTNNTDPNTLLNKFKDILSDEKIAHLAFLMGFFRTSGFKHLWELLCPSQDPARLDKFESVHLLVGINADKFAFELNNARLNAHDTAKSEQLKNDFKREFFAQQAQDLNEARYALSVEQSFEALLAAIRGGKLQIRIIKNRSTHAKFYIFATSPTLSRATQSKRYSGSLIVGSSNLSQSGLVKNYEFNLESRDSDDIAYALSEFYELWEDAVPLTDEPQSTADELEKALKEQSYLKECSVSDIYYKLLMEYFGEGRIKIDESLKGYFPRGFAKPDYQLAAIAEGLDKLEKYNGFFLSDVVGLGKTLIATIIAKIYENKSRKSLIICPAALKETWQHHAELVGLNHRKIVSYDMVEKEVKKPRDYTLFIIDESHNLTHTNTDRYKKIQPICNDINFKGEKNKVILLSATPQKNSPKDIENQLWFFQDKTRANIESINNLEEFFAPINKRFERLKERIESASKSGDENELKAAKASLNEISKRIVDEILRFVMIRRTRTDIENIEAFAKNLKEQNIKFPKIAAPQELNYDLSEKAENLAKQTLDLLAETRVENIGKFGYFRYLIYPNLTKEGQEKFASHYKDKQNFIENARSLVGLMKILMFKRFESSTEAFMLTLKTQIHSIETFVVQFERGEKILVPKNMNDLYQFYDDILNEKDEKISKYLEKNKAFELEISDFKADYEANLKSDLKALKNLLEKWQDIKDDPKIECLKAKLDEFKGQKVIIFTEAKDTANYLEKHLCAQKVLKIDASNRDKLALKIRENFDANLDKKEQKNDHDILIATDTLAEGVNLHRANIIINYDSPWNATKLMQRIGRINRVGTHFDEIFIYNFKPTRLGDLILKYNATAYQKLQSFHFTFGEDSPIYDENEEITQNKLFEQISAQQKQDEETPFLNDIKKLYHENEAEFERIRALKPKSRAFVRGLEKSFCYLKNAVGNNYFYEFSPKFDENSLNLNENSQNFAPNSQNADENSLNLNKNSQKNSPQPQESSFLQMASFLKENISKPVSKPSQSELERHYDEVEKFLKFHKEKFAQKPAQTLFDIKESTKNPRTTKALNKIRNLPQHFGLDEGQKAQIIAVLERGALANLATDIIKATRQEDFLAIFEQCKDRHAENLAQNELDTSPQIQLLLSNLGDKK